MTPTGRAHPPDPVESARVREETRARLFGQPVRRVFVDRFQVLRRLGSGATGVVYSAYDPRLDREVAIKVLGAGASADAVLAEARAQARLSHPNVLSVFEVGHAEGAPFIVSELVRGGSLRGWLAVRRRAVEILHMLLAIGRGLAAGHAAGLVHRDIKPENVLVRADGRPLLCDFGLARSTASADGWTEPGGAGTLRYMAPEQIIGAAVGPASDQFSFAVMAFESLTGSLPFEGDRDADLLSSIRAGRIRGVAVAPEVRPALAVLRRALADDPGARYPGMGSLLAALSSGAARRWPRRALAVVAALTAGALGAGVVLAYLESPRARERPPAPSSASHASVSAAPEAEDQEATLARETLAFTRAGRFDDCATFLSTRAKTDAMIATWIGCARGAHDPAHLEAACAAWNSASRGQTPDRTPELCGVPLPAARQRYRDGDLRGCVELILAHPPTSMGFIQLSRCASELRDPVIYRRVCQYSESMKPLAERTARCGRIVELR
jgi:hypothetical protein